MKKRELLMRRIQFVLAVLMLTAGFSISSFARTVTDEVNEFYITVDVNEDASLSMVYHILWTVLDDQAEGPLETMTIGLPNKNHRELTALTDTIGSISDAGETAKIRLDRKYYAGESVCVEFSLVQSSMYQIDQPSKGKTVYSFTPAWFDTMEVRDLKIFWNKEKAAEWEPEGSEEGQYLVFGKPLSAGKRFTMRVIYPNDAFAFSKGSSKSEKKIGSDVVAVLCLFAALILFFLVKFIAQVCFGLGKRMRGFGVPDGMEKKTTWALIEYYEKCPVCGTARKPKAEVCTKCGRKLIKAKRIVNPKNIKDPEKYSGIGIFPYEAVPGNYVQIVIEESPKPWKKNSGHISVGSSHRKSYGDSCVSSCDCACACASSGRTGCSVKGFFDREQHNRKIMIESKD